MGRDGWTGLAILAASLALLWATLGIERSPLVPISPAFYPRIVLAITAAMALALVAGDVLRHRRAAAAPAAARAEAPNYRLVAIAFAAFGAYVLALPWLGFRIATVLFLLAMPPLLELPRTRARWIVVVVVALVASAAAYYAFEHYLHVLMPRGRWTGF